jgi:hypothetical protein
MIGGQQGEVIHVMTLMIGGQQGEVIHVMTPFIHS